MLKKIRSRKAILISTFILILAIIAGITITQSFPSRTNLIDDTFASSKSKVLDGWYFVSIEYNGSISNSLQNLFSIYNINASVSKYDTLSLLNGVPRKPNVIIVNLLEKRVQEDIKVNTRIADILYRFSLNKTYVFFLTNDSNILQQVSIIFSPPLPVYSSQATNTIQYHNGTVSYEVVNQLHVIGRIYKILDGRAIPVNVAASVPYSNVNDIKGTIQEALKGLLTEIVNAEVDFASKGMV